MGIQNLIISNPKVSIVIISFLISLFITLIRYFMTDKEKMKEIKEKQKNLRAEMKMYKNNPEKMMEINQKMLNDMPEQMKQSFKPMLITLIPILLIFAWMRSVYSITAIADTWLWWYIISSIIFSIIFSKGFGLQ
ncbi:MAG: EMC3/TMCO1 family protein [Nanoarchaeota archaeon]